MKARVLMTFAVAVLGLGAVTAGAALGGKDDAEDAVLATVLLGENEIDEEGDDDAGDPDGAGGFTGVIRGTEICWGITVRGIDTPRAAHIHAAEEGENGPVVVPLTAPGDGDPGASSGCATIDAELAKNLLDDREEYYVNVHTEAFPAGALRGQLDEEDDD
jgi:CHRD domain